MVSGLWSFLVGHRGGDDNLKGGPTFTSDRFVCPRRHLFTVLIWDARLQVVSMGRKKFSADFQLMFRLLKLFLFVGSIGTLATLFTLLHLTVSDIFASMLAFIPTGWALLQVIFFMTTSSLYVHEQKP